MINFFLNLKEHEDLVREIISITGDQVFYTWLEEPKITVKHDENLCDENELFFSVEHSTHYHEATDLFQTFLIGYLLGKGIDCENL